MPDIIHRVGINAPVGKIYDILTSIEGARAWWDSNATGDANEGGVITFFKAFDMKVTQTKPNELVRWKCVRGAEEWMNTEISFQLLYKQDQTFVLFTHANWQKPSEFMHHCSTKWAVSLLSLKALVETGKGRPVPDDVQVYVGG